LCCHNEPLMHDVTLGWVAALSLASGGVPAGLQSTELLTAHFRSSASCSSIRIPFFFVAK